MVVVGAIRGLAPNDAGTGPAASRWGLQAAALRRNGNESGHPLACQAPLRVRRAASVGVAGFTLMEMLAFEIVGTSRHSTPDAKTSGNVENASSAVVAHGEGADAEGETAVRSGPLTW